MCLKPVLKAMRLYQKELWSSVVLELSVDGKGIKKASNELECVKHYNGSCYFRQLRHFPLKGENKYGLTPVHINPDIFCTLPECLCVR